MTTALHTSIAGQQVRSDLTYKIPTYKYCVEDNGPEYIVYLSASAGFGRRDRMEYTQDEHTTFS